MILHYAGGPVDVQSRGTDSPASRALHDHGIDPQHLIDLPGDSTGTGGLAIGQHLLDASVMPDAILCHSDQVAFGVYRALRKARTPHYLASSDTTTSPPPACGSLHWQPSRPTPTTSDASPHRTCSNNSIARRTAHSPPSPNQSSSSETRADATPDPTGAANSTMTPRAAVGHDHLADPSGLRWRA
jgi:hypothetical protein